MTRYQALEYLRSVHPLLPSYSILSEALGRESVERKAAAVAARHGHDPFVRRMLYGESDIEDALEMLRLRAVYRLDRGRNLPVAREDLVELLSVSISEVRVLGIRLSGRQHDSLT